MGGLKVLWIGVGWGAGLIVANRFNVIFTEFMYTNKQG